MVHRTRVALGIVVFGSASVMAQTPDFAEGNAHQWGTFASDGASRSVVNSTERVKVGSSSILFTTASGFDTGVSYPANANLNLDASGYNTLLFWEYPENTTPIGWQGHQPVVVIRTGVGSASPGTIRLTPTTQQTPNRAWKLFKVPLAGGEGWVRETIGTPNLSDVDQVQIHHDTWDAGFRIWFDGVRFVSLDPNGLPPAGPPPPEGVDPDRIEPRVLLYISNPVMTNYQGRRMNEVYGWGDPIGLTNQVISDFEASSHGRVRFRVVDVIDDTEFPYLESGFRYTPASFDAAWRSGNLQPGTFDYVRFGVENGLGARVDSGEIDEVWVYSFPGAGMWESAMAGRGAYWINGGAYPAAGGERAFVIMGWNFERGVGEAIHSWGHRAESMMVRCYGEWRRDRGNTWSRFALIDRDAPGLGGVGNVHFPVNGASDYDYANPRFVLSNADAWLNYPDLDDRTRSINWREWSPDGSDPHRRYLNWWYFHMPHMPGRAPDYLLANWWRYLCDPDQFKSSGCSLFLTIGIPEVSLTSPAEGSLVSGVVRVTASAEVDGALGRVDLYVDGAYYASDTMSPYVFEWDTARFVGERELVVKAYELQNGTETVSSAVRVRVRCPGDFNDDGFIDFFDLDAFLECFEGGACPEGRSADFNGDGFVDFFDADAYLSAFDAGC
ncbi:MAG: hypothetical protein HRU70_06770 [Phycisphaeraceae bacterium]|nr:MAG: hypothetical protein HRU70_06770 [Phycisphaeraceae bacterium]